MYYVYNILFIYLNPFIELRVALRYHLLFKILFQFMIVLHYLG